MGFRAGRLLYRTHDLTNTLLYEIAEWFLEKVFESGAKPGSLFIFTHRAVSVE